MTNLENFRYTLASAGYSIERIQEAEQNILDISIVTGANPEQIASYALVGLEAMISFQEAMEILKSTVTDYKEAAEMLLSVAQDAGIVDKPVKKTERTPYYQKNRRQWWK